MSAFKVGKTTNDVDFGKTYNISIDPTDKYFICGGVSKSESMKNTDIHVYEIKTMIEVNTIEGMTEAFEPYFFDNGRKVYCHSIIEQACFEVTTITDDWQVLFKERYEYHHMVKSVNDSIIGMIDRNK